MPKTRKNNQKRHIPWAGWARISPKGYERTVMLRKCGTKCFLGPDKSVPVCAKDTCKVSVKGLYAAYVRAREWGNKRSSYRGKARPSRARSVYTSVASKAKRMLKSRGKFRGKKQTQRR